MRAFANRQAKFIAQSRRRHCRQEMENIFLYFAAPVLCGAKPAALITIRPHCLSAWRERQNALQKATGLRTLELRNQCGSILLLIYDELAMCSLLQDERTRQLLIGHGYPAGCDPGKMLRHLQSRFSDAVFPHEIGVLLGYPPEDVLGFIKSGGQDFVCCRYWKVYHNVELAKEMFRKIDEAYCAAMDLLEEPTPIHVVARLLKAV